jgi:hypothetical protein
MVDNTFTHPYFFSAPLSINLPKEYLLYLLQQRGGFQNVPGQTKKLLIEKIGDLRLENFRQKGLSISDYQNLFNTFLKEKVEEKGEFDSFILPCCISKGKFRNRSPQEILYELDKENFVKLSDILCKGFPIIVEDSLYIFYIGEIESSIYAYFYRDFSDESRNYSLGNFRIYLTELFGENIALRLVDGRPFYNSLLFLLKLYTVLIDTDSIDKVRRKQDLVLWMKKEMEGKVLIIKDVLYIFDNFLKRKNGKYIEVLKDSNLVRLLAYLQKIKESYRKSGKNDTIIDSLIDKFAFFLLVHHDVDPYVFDQIAILSVDVYDNIGYINKGFIITFMEEVKQKSFSEYFELGQEIGKSIYDAYSSRLSKSGKNENEIREEIKKIILRVAKDLRNEELPGYFLEALEKNLISLKSDGVNFRERVGKLLGKLSLVLETCDLSTFYLIKASIILGMISPPPND